MSSKETDGKSKEYCSKQFLGTCEYLQEAKTEFDCLLKVSGNKRAMRNEGLAREVNKWRKEAKASMDIQAQLEERVFAARGILRQIYADLKKSPQPQDMNVRFSTLLLDNLNEALNLNKLSKRQPE